MENRTYQGKLVGLARGLSCSQAGKGTSYRGTGGRQRGVGRGRVLTAAEGFGYWAGRQEARVRGRRGDKGELELAMARPGGPARRLSL